MHKTHNKFLIISFTLVFILGVYSYLQNDFVGKVFSADSSLTSSLATTADISTPASDISSKTQEDIAFINQLTSLTKITIDSSLFSDKTFTSLVDNNIKLDVAPYGRTNPFSPINSPVVLQTVSPIITKPATAITSKSAVLNGSLDGGVVSKNIYFEYGVTDTFGKVTSKATASLVGNFGSTVLDLTPKTTYFYRAAANINGNIILGEVMSFNTN